MKFDKKKSTIIFHPIAFHHQHHQRRKWQVLLDCLPLFFRTKQSQKDIVNVNKPKSFSRFKGENTSQLLQQPLRFQYTVNQSRANWKCESFFMLQWGGSTDTLTYILPSAVD